MGRPPCGGCRRLPPTDPTTAVTRGGDGERGPPRPKPLSAPSLRTAGRRRDPDGRPGSPRPHAPRSNFVPRDRQLRPPGPTASSLGTDSFARNLRLPPRTNFVPDSPEAPPRPEPGAARGKRRAAIFPRGRPLRRPSPVDFRPPQSADFQAAAACRFSGRRNLQIARHKAGARAGRCRGSGAVGFPAPSPPEAEPSTLLGLYGPLGARAEAPGAIGRRPD